MEKNIVKTLIRELAKDEISKLKELNELSIKDAWLVVQDFVIITEKNRDKFVDVDGGMLGECLAEVLNEEIDIKNMPSWLEDNYFKVAVSAVVAGMNKNFGNKWASKLLGKDGTDSFFQKASDLSGKAKDVIFEKGEQLKDKATEWKDSSSKYMDDKISSMIKEKLSSIIEEKFREDLDERIHKIVDDKMNAVG